MATKCAAVRVGCGSIPGAGLQPHSGM